MQTNWKSVIQGTVPRDVEHIITETYHYPKEGAFKFSLKALSPQNGTLVEVWTSDDFKWLRSLEFGNLHSHHYIWYRLPGGPFAISKENIGLVREKLSIPLQKGWIEVYHLFLGIHYRTQMLDIETRGAFGPNTYTLHFFRKPWELRRNEIPFGEKERVVYPLKG